MVLGTHYLIKSLGASNSQCCFWLTVSYNSYSKLAAKIAKKQMFHLYSFPFLECNCGFYHICYIFVIINFDITDFVIKY